MVAVPKLLLLAAVPLLATAQASGADGSVPGGQLLRGGSRELVGWNYWEGRFAGFGTFFHGMGHPFGGCGVPPGKAHDDNGKPLPYIALNTNSHWHNGANCGRWVEITLGQNCEMGGNTQWSVCNNGHMEDDHYTGQTIYGYVMDSCGDHNFWCQNDADHLDISEQYLNSMGLRQGSTMAARMLHWKWISWVPHGYSMHEPEFMIMEGSRSIGYEFWVSVIIRNVRNGIGKVEQKMPWGWQQVNQLSNLGNTYEMVNPDPGNGNAWTSSIGIRVWGKDNDFYGAWEISFPCGNSACHPSLDAHKIARLH